MNISFLPPANHTQKKKDNYIISKGPVIYMDPQEKFTLIAHIYTPPELRGKGLMRELVENELMPKLKKEGLPVMVFNTPEKKCMENKLLGFWESQGFEFSNDLQNSHIGTIFFD